MKITWISDFNLMGSGYLNLSVPLLSGLAARGHVAYCAGLGYKGQEHDYPFSIIPVTNLQEAHGIVNNVTKLAGTDVLVVALDIPVQLQLIRRMEEFSLPYVGIMPLEADPMCMTWTMALMTMTKPFIISEFGTAEAHRVGLTSAEHIRIGLDTDAWRIPTDAERTMLRQSLLGINDEEDDFVVLTVADNQERKHLSRSMEIFAEFSKDKPNTKYVLVTREQLSIGWYLRDFAQEIGISDNFLIFERGMPFKELWSIYAASDAFLLASKAEGLGLPLLEAMAVGLPCIGTNCTAMAEVLGNGRGLLMDVDYVHRDPFGNGRRYFASIESGVSHLNQLYENRSENLQNPTNLEYIQGRDWETAVDTLERSLLEIVNEQNE